MDTVPIRYIYADETAPERFGGIEAGQAGEELDRIRRNHGRLQPATVVDESRPEEAPLHPAFEWRDEVAAEKFREHQASDLIRQVRVVVEHQAPQEMPVSRARPAADANANPRRPAIDWDPLAPQVEEAIGAVVEAQRKLQVLRDAAARRMESKRRIQADVALRDCQEAEELLNDAHSAMTSAQEASRWPVGIEKAAAGTIS
jgi:hypothetical protein